LFNIEVKGVVKQFEFTPHDVIFELAEKNNTSHPSQTSKCNCCSKSWTSKKDYTYCDFCALVFCFDCQSKTRKFPRSKDSTMGAICKVCDRKFHVRELVKDRNLQIEAQTMQLLSRHGMMAQVEQHEKKNNEIRREGKKH
jgi:hypothetical protein